MVGALGADHGELRKQVKDGKPLIQREAGVRGHWSDMRANALADNPSLAGQQVIAAFDNWSRSQRRRSDEHHAAMEERLDELHDLQLPRRGFRHDGQLEPVPLQH